jgi:hypothetical protein
MPTRTDVTVVNQAYDTSGNGGRKLVQLSNGWLVACEKDTINDVVYFQVDKQDGQGFQPLCYSNIGSSNTLVDVALEKKGTRVFVLISWNLSNSQHRISFISFDVVAQTNVDIGLGSVIEVSTLQGGNCSIVINEAGTELHATWSNRVSTYSNSNNIRYAKGTINGDGSVTWDAVTQVTKINTSGYDHTNPSIVVRNNIPVIICQYDYSTSQKIIMSYTTSHTTREAPLSTSEVDSSWGNKAVYNGGSYAQSSPSACVAPNGRIWVAWHGRDAADSNVDNIRVAYSDDGGQTWSSMAKLTSGNIYHQLRASITANKNNEVFIVWQGTDTDGFYDIRMAKYNGSWGSISVVSAGTTGHKHYPSTLYDITLDFSIPLLIYQDTQNNKVGFYGTWTVTTISVTPGYIGQKTSADKSNILSYSITTDGTMSTITEKINGVTIATRTNPTSGQQFTVSLTQEQWDAIKYGNAHTLTITMGSDTWTYTFNKRLNANDDILSAVKGVQDLQTHLNGIKAQLGAAIRAKGGTVNDTDAWSAFVSAVANMQVKRWASGTVTSSSSTLSFEYAGSTSTNNTYYVTVSGLSFKPSLIILQTNNVSNFSYLVIYNEINDGFYPKTVKVSQYDIDAYGGTSINYKGDKPNASVTNEGFTLPVYASSAIYNWIAFE